MSAEDESSPLSARRAEHRASRISFVVPHIIENFVEHEPAANDRVAVRRSIRIDGNANANLQFKVQPEACRFIAYFGFWTMCILAIILTNTLVAPILEEGIKEGELACPPFDGGYENGFDIATESHLVRAFGFNNICSNWDYSPSREITAGYYPMFEYPLLIYICADFLSVALHWKKGLVSNRYYYVFRTLFPFLIICCAWFRLIFVMIAYDNVSGHTFGFLMLQMALILVACLNVWFIVESQIEYKYLGGPKTKYFAYGYLIGNTIISSIKLYLTGYVVFSPDPNAYPSWANTPFGSGTLVPGQVIDYIWMIFNAIIPFIASFVRARHEKPLEITIDFQAMPMADVIEDIPEDESQGNGLTEEGDGNALLKKEKEESEEGNDHRNA